MSSIGSKIKSLRLKKDISLEKMANELNERFQLSLNKGMISKWESDLTEPRLEHIRCLAEYFSVTVDFLIGLEEMNTIFQEESPSIPKRFSDATAAREYIARHEIFGSEGFDLNKKSDVEVLNIANEMLDYAEYLKNKHNR